MTNKPHIIPPHVQEYLDMLGKGHTQTEVAKHFGKKPRYISTVTRYHTDPEFREKVKKQKLEQLKKWHQKNPEKHKEHIEKQKQRYKSDPEFRQRTKDYSKEYHADLREHRKQEKIKKLQTLPDPEELGEHATVGKKYLALRKKSHTIQQIADMHSVAYQAVQSLITYHQKKAAEAPGLEYPKVKRGRPKKILSFDLAHIPLFESVASFEDTLHPEHQRTAKASRSRKSLYARQIANHLGPGLSFSHTTNGITTHTFVPYYKNHPTVKITKEAWPSPTHTTSHIYVIDEATGTQKHYATKSVSGVLSPILNSHLDPKGNYIRKHNEMCREWGKNIRSRQNAENRRIITFKE